MLVGRFFLRASLVLPALALFAAPAAHAAYIVSIQQVGSNVVVANGSGSIDTTDLTLLSNNTNSSAQLKPATANLIVGPTLSLGVDVYTGLTGPSSFGSASSDPAPGSGFGSTVGISESLSEIAVPHLSAGQHMDSSGDTWSNQTLSSLGLTPGTYTYTWGSSTHADTFTVQIGPTPEPTSLALLAFTAIPLLGRRRNASHQPQPVWFRRSQ